MPICSTVLRLVPSSEIIFIEKKSLDIPAIKMSYRSVLNLFSILMSDIFTQRLVLPCPGISFGETLTGEMTFKMYTKNLTTKSKTTSIVFSRRKFILDKILDFLSKLSQTMVHF